VVVKGLGWLLADGHARENFLSGERKFSLLSSIAIVKGLGWVLADGHARENFLSPERKFTLPSAVGVGGLGMLV